MPGNDAYEGVVKGKHVKRVGELRPMRFRAIGPIIRAAGLVPWTMSFAVLYLITSAMVAEFEPGVTSFGDAAWLMFQVATTIGLGDFSCTTFVGRVCVIALSIYSIFFLALITGAVVSYCGERMRYRRDRSVAHFIAQLERLQELDRDELAEISRKVRRL